MVDELQWRGSDNRRAMAGVFRITLQDALQRVLGCRALGTAARLAREVRPL